MYDLQTEEGKRLAEIADLMYAALMEVDAFFMDPGMEKQDAIGTQEIVRELLNHVPFNTNIDLIKSLIRGKA